MGIKTEITSTRVPVKKWTDEIEAKALQQLQNIAALPIVHHHVEAMPDVHLGIASLLFRLL